MMFLFGKSCLAILYYFLILFDNDQRLIDAAKKTGCIVTAEEHNVIGGLVDAVISAVSEKCPVPVKKCGIYDRFGYSGPAKELLEIFGCTASGIEKEVKAFLGK